MKSTLDYIPDGQISIFDYLEPTEKFPTIINDLSKDISKIIDVEKEEYEIWEHVPNLGYRYSCTVTLFKSEYETVIDKILKLVEDYKKLKLEISVGNIPYFKNSEKLNLFISTLWKDKERAKRG